MTKAKKFLSVFLVLTTLLSLVSLFTVSASAITVGKKYSVSSLMNNSVTFYVEASETKNGSITFKSRSYQFTCAPTLYLTVYNCDTGRTTYKRITGTCSTYVSTLKLDKNCDYYITVSYIWDRSLNYKLSYFNLKKVWVTGDWWISSYSNCTIY
jgi:hypothetical protein